MDSVLEKTVASLERALRYNPENMELMISLAEGYIRMGKLDETTLGLCETILDEHPDKTLLHQAQAVTYVIEQTHQIEAGLAEGKAPPPTDAVLSSLGILEDFLREIREVGVVWQTWTRLCLVAGLLDNAKKGVEQLKALKVETLASLQTTLDWLAQHHGAMDLNWRSLFELYSAIGQRSAGLAMLEQTFDQGVAADQIGPILLEVYLERYSSSNPIEVPLSTRPRLFQVLLDHGEREMTGEWLRKASLYGWEINNYSKDYVGELVETGELHTAFEILQRMVMDQEVKDLLNLTSEKHEDRDEIDEAVNVLRYINNHELIDPEQIRKREIELARETERSLAELHIKNGRPEDAVATLINALCLAPEPDGDLVEQIDDILRSGIILKAELPLRLGHYFRNRGDNPKAVFYLNRILEHQSDHADALGELESIFGDLLEANPGNPELFLELGYIHYRLGETQRAEDEFRLALASPEHADRANRRLAEIYLTESRLTEALKSFQNYTPNEEDLELLYDLHLALTKEKDYASAMSAVSMLRAIDPEYRDIAVRAVQLDEWAERTQPGAAADAKMRELIGDMAIGRYRYIDKIGSGGMGIVHKVTDLQTQRSVAMKILRECLGGSSKILDRFFREARIAGSLRHRNIVQILDYNISSSTGQSYICMEFVDGPTVRELIDGHFENAVFADAEFTTEMLYYTSQLLDALYATHSKGLIHRDIKPDNVMVNAIGEVKITDFGIVHVEEATFTPSGAMLGTPRYMSPEQVTGGKIDGRSDLYSAGIVVYEALTGAPPFVAGDIAYQQVNKEPSPPIETNPMISPRINDFIMRCIAKAPDERFADARIAKAEIDSILLELGGCMKYDNLTAVVEEDPEIPEGATVFRDDLDPIADSDLDLGELDIDPPAGDPCEAESDVTPAEACPEDSPEASASGSETPGHEIEHGEAAEDAPPAPLPEDCNLEGPLESDQSDSAETHHTDAPLGETENSAVESPEPGGEHPSKELSDEPAPASPVAQAGDLDLDMDMDLDLDLDTPGDAPPELQTEAQSETPSPPPAEDDLDLD